MFSSFKPGNRKTIVLELTVIICLLAVVIIILWVNIAAPVIAVGPLSSANSLWLTVGVTLGATLFTGIISSQLQNALLRSLEDRLRQIGQNLDLVRVESEPNTSELPKVQREIVEQLDRKWRGVLRIDSFGEKLHNYRYFLLYLFCSLNTAAIVTSLHPSLTTKLVPYNAVIPDTDFGIYSDATNRSCVGICDPPCQYTDIKRAFYWQFPNGSAFYSSDSDECPASSMIRLAAGINTINIEDHIYVQSGIAIERAAIGAPATIYSGAALGNLSSQFGQALMQTTQCVPVMTSNPVRCQTGGHVGIFPPNELRMNGTNITAFAQDWPTAEAQSGWHFTARNVTYDSVMTKKLLSYNNYSDNGNIGQSVLVFGALTDPQGQVPFASYLAGTMSDPDKNAGRAGGSTYAVTCVTDPQNVFEYRFVTLNLRSLEKGQQKNNSNIAQYLSGGGPCTPVRPTISNKIMGTAAVANYQLIQENNGIDGYFSTIAGIAGFNRGPPYAFPDSRNALEDTLGLVSALAVSIIPLTGEGTPVAATTGEFNNTSTALIEVTRLGADGWQSIWLLLPPAGSLVILISMFCLSIRRRWVPGGNTSTRTDGDKPTRYAAESLYQLITLGWAYEGQGQALLKNYERQKQ